MTYELLNGTLNVIRFPVEDRARPTIELMRDLRPDPRVVLYNAEVFGFDPPPVTLQSDVDRETASHIATETPAGERTSAMFLDGLLDPVVSRAVTLAREAAKAQREATDAHNRAAHATVAESVEAEWLQQRATAAAIRVTEFGLMAHLAADEAEGVARAVKLAREGTPWTPRNRAEEGDDWMMPVAPRSA